MTGHLFSAHHAYRKNICIHTRQHACATVQQCLRHSNNCILSCNLSSAQETARINASRPWRSRSCVATQTSSDFPPWYVLHPVCLYFMLALGRHRDDPQNFISTIFAGFSNFRGPKSYQILSFFLTFLGFEDPT